MLPRICSLILVIGLAGSPASVNATEPPDAEDIVVYHDIPYREGTSRQWKLDLAMKKDTRGKPKARDRRHPRRRMARRG